MLRARCPTSFIRLVLLVHEPPFCVLLTTGINSLFVVRPQKKWQLCFKKIF